MHLATCMLGGNSQVTVNRTVDSHFESHVLWNPRRVHRGVECVSNTDQSFGPLLSAEVEPLALADKAANWSLQLEIGTFSSAEHGILRCKS